MLNFLRANQPGGCLDCKMNNKVYGENGNQICIHHDIMSENLLQQQLQRALDLRAMLKDTVPLSMRPVWRDKKELRQHCLARCDAGEKNRFKR